MNTDDVMCASCAMHAPASQPSQDIYDAPEINYWHAIHFCTLNNENANENMLKRIVIVMCNENKANFHDNFRTYSQEP